MSLIPTFISAGGARRQEPLSAFHPTVTETLSREDAAKVREDYRAFCKQYGIGVAPPPPPVEGGHRDDLSAPEVAQRILAESLFEASAQELKEIQSVLEDVGRLHAEIADHCPDSVIRKFKASTPTPDRVPLEEQHRRSREFKRHLKIQAEARVARFAPTAIAIAGRALDVLQGNCSLREDSERSIALAFGVKYEESRTLRVMRAASVWLEQFLASTRANPGTCDFRLLARTVAPHAG